MRFWKNVVALIIGNGTTQVISFAFLIILVRYYNQLDYSIYQQVNLLLNTMTPLLILGIPISLSYYLPRKLDERSHNQYLINAVAALTLVGGFGAVLLFVFGDSVAAAYNNPQLAPYMGSVSLIVFGETIFAFYPFALVAVGRARKLAIVTAIFAVIRIVTLLICAFSGFSISVLLTLLAMNSLIKMAYGLWYIFQKIRAYGVQLDRKTFIEQSLFSIPQGLAVISFNLMSVLDKNLTSIFYTPLQFAIYANGVYNIPFVSILTGSVSSALLPRLSAIFEKSNQASLDKSIQIWHNTVVVTSFAMISLTFVMMAFAEEFITLIFTDLYIASTPVFRIYLLVLLSKLTYFGNLLTVAEKQRALLFSGIVGVGVLIVSFIAIHFLFGFDYIVWAVVIANFVFVGLLLWYIMRTYNQSLSQVYPWRTTAIMVIVGFGLTIVFHWLKAFLDLSPIIILIVLGSIMGSLCLLLYVILIPELRAVTLGMITRILRNLKILPSVSASSSQH